MALARHVTFVHQFKKNPELDFEPFDPKFLKLYISQVGDVCAFSANEYLTARADAGRFVRGANTKRLSSRGELVTTFFLSFFVA